MTLFLVVQITQQVVMKISLNTELQSYFVLLSPYQVGQIEIPNYRNRVPTFLTKRVFKKDMKTGLFMACIA
jgi:hypothetical protein